MNYFISPLALYVQGLANHQVISNHCLCIDRTHLPQRNLGYQVHSLLQIPQVSWLYRPRNSEKSF
jgi:hypothetical protein